MRTEFGDFGVSVELIDLRGGSWSPTFTSGSVGEGGGVIVTEKAARDLGVTVGDTVVLHHPQRQGLMSYTMVDSELPVLATHPYPLRNLTYMDIGDADMFGLTGVTNALSLQPAPGATVADVQRELFDHEWVASVVAVRAVTESVRNAFDEVLGVIDVMAVAALLLVLLIAFNTASINLESRAREHATMFAYGVKVRTALWMASTESLVLGLAATVLGVGGGLVMVWWITQRVLAGTMPDVALNVVLMPGTLALTAAMGVLAVTLAPVFTIRRMRRMDLPGTLRLVE
jgi:putative ABC transport system permease protein